MVNWWKYNKNVQKNISLKVKIEKNEKNRRYLVLCISLFSFYSKKCQKNKNNTLKSKINSFPVYSYR